MTDSITHVGIPGMHWGVRRGRSSGSGSHVISRKPTTLSSDHVVAARIKKKKISEMSNEEIRTLTTRIQLEQQYKALNPSKVAKGAKIVGKLLIAVGGQKAKEIAARETGAKMEVFWAAIKARNAVKNATGK